MQAVILGFSILLAGLAGYMTSWKELKDTEKIIWETRSVVMLAAVLIESLIVASN